MADWVVDTNVLLVATRAALGDACSIDVPVTSYTELEAVFTWLENFRRSSDEILVIDLVHRLIQTEYSNKLNKEDYGRKVIAEKLSRFQYRTVEVECDDNGGALVLHEAGQEVFDRADRKMVAAALEASAPIANACDAGWCELERRGSLVRLGITVHHLIETWCRALWETNRDRWSSK